jgi:septal ring-binding cell division protein DamX
MMIASIAERLGIPEPNARILYDQWLEQASMTLNAGKPVTVKGLGTFTIDNEQLAFQADPELELFGNRVYAGLEALAEEEMTPAPVEADHELDDPFAEIINPKKDPAPPKKVILDITPAPEPADDAPKKAPEPVKAGFTLDTEAMDEPAFEPDPEPEPEPEPPVIDAYSPEDFEEPAMEPDLTSDETTAPEKKNLTAWIIAIPVVVVVLIAGWYGVQYLSSSMEKEMAATPAPAPATATATPAESNAAAVPAEASASPLATAEYGIRGPVNPLQGRVYGIIVHSLPVKADSDAQCAKISTAGLRCSVVEAERNGAPTYRVAIGQFATAADAQKATTELPAEYAAAEKHFIARIQ